MQFRLAKIMRLIDSVDRLQPINAHRNGYDRILKTCMGPSCDLTNLDAYCHVIIRNILSVTNMANLDE